MALLLMIFRKMMRNRWLMLSLFIGYVLFIALMCSIPLYTNGIMQSMLVREFETQQAERNQYPGVVRVDSDYDYYIGGFDKRKQLYGKVTDYLVNEFLPDAGIGYEQSVTYHQTAIFRVLEDRRQRQVPKETPAFKFAYYSGMYDNIKLVSGDLPSDNTDDGVYEVLVTELSLYQNNLAVGDEFVIRNQKLGDKGVKTIRIVGSFSPDTSDPLYWFDNMTNSKNSIFVNSKVFENEFLTDFTIDKTTWYYAMDYRQINVDNVEHVFGVYNDLEKWVRNMGFQPYIPTMNSLPEFKERQSGLVPLLLSLYGPIIIMLLFYLFMVSSLVVDKQKNELAVLVSRGAGRMQLMFINFIESLMLGAAGMAAGPFLGVVLTRVLGSTTNFLEFVNRKALDINVNRQTYLFALAGLVLSIATTLLPAYFATGRNIIEHKRTTSRRGNEVFWKKYFLDFVLLAVSLYGYYRFTVRQKDLLSTNAQFLSIDPLLFVVSALFTLSIGLIFIRIFPYLAEGLYRAGRRFWPLPVYTSLIQVARSASSYQFLMLFIVITVSTGIFSATAARTMNQNAQDKIRYAHGADHILMAQWSQGGVFTSDSSAPAGAMGPQQPAEEAAPSASAQYDEPPYARYAELKGVERTTKVLNIEGKIYGNKGTFKVKLMGIEPVEFAKTAYYPNGLSGKHWYNYINQLTASRNIVLISRSIAEKAGLKQWDTFTMNWQPNGMTEFIVGDIIDYWPSWNPNLKADPDNGIYDMLVVANLSYIFDNSILQPYEVWMKMAPGSTTEELYDDIKAKKLKIDRISDINEDYIALNRDPVHLGLNGALTLVFLISILIIISGFFIFWILAIYARMFQSGIMMAMGIRLRELVSMMTWEQLLTSVIPMLFGVAAGTVSSALFVPMFQMSFAAKDQIPPFRVIAYSSDYIRIYVILGLMMLAGLTIIAYMLSRLNIFSCIKLGEDG